MELLVARTHERGELRVFSFPVLMTTPSPRATRPRHIRCPKNQGRPTPAKFAYPAKSSSFHQKSPNLLNRYSTLSSSN
jgi:hypothetical protein